MKNDGGKGSSPRQNRDDAAYGSNYDLIFGKKKVEPKTETLEELVLQFFSYLDKTEESDSGRIFHLLTFTSVRVMDGVAVNVILQKMRSIVKD
jgi:hypothetical protein